MRIIAGTARGAEVGNPRGNGSASYAGERVKEALFNICNSR